MKSKVLYLYPFVHVNIKNKALLYNTINNKSLITTKIAIKELLAKLFNSQNKVIILESDILKNHEIYDFLLKIVDLNMGNILDYSDSKKLPLQFINRLKIQKEIEFLKTRNDRSIGEDILNYLKEVVVYLNSACSLLCKSCDYGYRQIVTCKKGKAGEEIDLILFKRLVNIIDTIPIETLHITGGDIFKYSNLSEVISLIHERKFSTVFHINSQNLLDDYNEINKKVFENDIFNVVINNYEDLEYKSLFNFLNDNIPNWDATFMVENEEQLEIAEKACKNLDQSKIEVKAIYNKHNMTFFNENVFIKEEFLLEEKHDLHSIMQKQGLNTNFFGSMILDCDGELYSNFSHKSLGNFKTISIQEAIFKELKTNLCWRFLRQDVEPCSQCFYNLLCPAIGPYEFEIGRFNLCDISIKG